MYLLFLIYRKSCCSLETPYIVIMCNIKNVSLYQLSLPACSI